MREIKFRAWDKKTNKIYQITDIDFSNYIANGVCYGDWQEFSTSNLLQYTGLKDKNGVEIYEGDIIIVAEEDEDSCMGREFRYKGVVSYENSLKLSRYVPQYPSSFCLISKSFYKEQALLFNERWSYEVIGNIYENPELIKDNIC